MGSLLFAAAEATHAGDGGWWADTAGIMLISPFVAFLPSSPSASASVNGAEFAIGALAINTVWAVVLFVLT